MSKLKLFFLALIYSITGFAQDSDSTFYKCATCSNALFLDSEIVREKKQIYIVNFNKTNNPFRNYDKEKDVHCSHCNRHIGYLHEDESLEIIHSNVHKNGKQYDCSFCKKPLLNESDLKKTTPNTYIFNHVNDEDITISNRSYILNNKQLHCSFCYDVIGKSKKKNKLIIFKKNIIKPHP
ncbi:MAG: hypothetical protein K0B10_13395 [Vicingaceae bacterium]|nr:hypothetical protein [Vicingaceae bacterium]